MLLDWNAIGIMATVAGSVGGTAFFLGRKISSMVSREQCNKKTEGFSDKLESMDGRIDGIDVKLARIEQKIDGNYKEG